MIAQEKRDKLIESIPDNSLIILVGKREQLRNGDVFYPFRQDSDFLLLTWLNIPDLIVIGIKKNKWSEWRLYSESITEREKIWWTSRLSGSELSRLSGIEEVRDLKYASRDIRESIESSDYVLIRSELSYRDEKDFLRKFRLQEQKEKLWSLTLYMKSLRMYKTDEEVEYIRKAIDITHKAYLLLWFHIHPWMYEYQIEAIIAWLYRSYQSTEAYPTIVWSGPSSSIIHYNRHDRKIQAWDHILIDFGAEYRGYAADVTRIFFTDAPSERRRAIYESIKQVKIYAESLIRPWLRRLEYEKSVRERMDEALIQLWLISISMSPISRQELSRKYYPHSTSHFLGLDVHDTGERDDIFEAGMVITCEPGIYIREEGIGMRLEDDLLITDTGCENLSRGIPF